MVNNKQEKASKYMYLPAQNVLFHSEIAGVCGAHNLSRLWHIKAAHHPMEATSTLDEMVGTFN